MSCKLTVLPMIILAGLFCAVHSTAAQERRRPSAAREAGLVELVRNLAIQQELGIDRDSETARQIAKLVASLHFEQLQKTSNLQPDQSAQAKTITSELNAKYETDLQKLLSNEQMTRLQQIHWQRLGYDTLTKPEIVKALDITAEQLEKLTAFNQQIEQDQIATNARLIELNQLRNNGGDDQEIQSKTQELMEQRVKVRTRQTEQFQKLLTRTQQDKFTELKGTPFVPRPIRMPVSLRVGHLFNLALQESIQKELGISADAAELPEIRKFLAAMQVEVREKLREQDAPDRAAEIELAIDSKYEPLLAGLLKPEQFTRLKQISLQQSEVRALMNPDVVAALKITEEQQAEMAKLNQEVHLKSLALMNRPLQAGTIAEQTSQKLQELTADRDKKLLQILTDTQRVRFTELKGKPFDVSQLRGRQARSPVR
ncbi:MAG: hypothetical protein JSS49_12320 [Planctomycetes bacterium]|nr:hypothetical protein [Planctomycetota bacterium]